MSENLKILIVEDDEIDYFSLSKQLEIAFPNCSLTIDWIKNAHNIDYMALFAPYDICLIDQNLNGFLGLEIIQNMHRTGCMVPMILLTDEEDNPVDIQTAAGATGCLVKEDISPSLLNHSIRSAITQKKHEERLVDLAYQDGLTGIANRKKFDDYMEMCLSSTARSRTPLGLILIDLDDFKLINDTHGHLYGDMLLKEVASRLQSAVRVTDLVARLGGDEFSVTTTLLKNEDDMNLVLEKVDEVFATPFGLGDVSVSITASIGAALKQSDETITFRELFRRADLSLYSAKFRGKNITQFYATHPHDQNDQKTALPTGLHSALQKGEFKILYQPKIRIVGQTLSGVEALIRWHPDGRDPVLPGNFIPAAEQSGDILPIGQWVIETACAQIRSWKEDHGVIIPVAVNVSPVQICRSETVSFIHDTLKKYALAPNLLEIEVTESPSFSDHALLSQNLLHLHHLGCHIALDDFGIGYSSFQRLIDIPISSLKIDRSFIKNIGQSAKVDATCRSIVTLANSLGIPVLAEGIETSSQLKSVEDFHCKHAQGYFIKEPVEAEPFMDWLIQYEGHKNGHPAPLKN